jgi:cell filamentation protein, protein adenylyltransferase
MNFKPKFTITNRIANDLAHIMTVKGFLEAAVLSPAWINAMQHRALLLEAHYTTHIEGTQLTLEQAKKVLQGEKPAHTHPDDVQELINYRDAVAALAAYLASDAPVTQGLIREIHQCLVKDVRGNSAAPGEYRKIQNYVVNSSTGATVYTPPPAYEIPRLMQELVDYINTAKEVHAVLVAGIAQFQLVHIHPFLDGNGRTARLLSTCCLYLRGYDFKQLFTISEYYDKNRADYYQAIQAVREHGMDMTGWLEYFTHGLAEQMQEIKAKGGVLIQSNSLAKQHQLSERQTQLLHYALQHDELTIKEFEKITDTPRRTLQRDLKNLVLKKLLLMEGATNQVIYKLAPNLRQTCAKK